MTDGFSSSVSLDADSAAEDPLLSGSNRKLFAGFLPLSTGGLSATWDWVRVADG